MKAKVLSCLLLSLCVAQTHAANIAWVSFHAADDAPSAAAAAAGFTTAADIGYTSLLRANGHNVTRFVTVDNLDANPDIIDALNTNDLVILSRSVPSGHYEVATETAAWNSSITAPMIITGGYLLRNNRLGFTTGTTMPDVNSNPVRLTLLSPLHPIFNGVSVGTNNLMVNPYAQRVTFTNGTGGTTLQNGISVNNNGLAPGAIRLANVGTAGDAAINGMVIAEYPAGVTLNSRDVLAGNRLVFLTGSRESGITSEGSGIYDLLPDGEKMFLNAVNYMSTEMAPVVTRMLASGTNLVVGDRWTFDAGIIGTAPLTYQWYKDSQPLATGTDATLAFANVAAADAGQYYVIAANALGKATSSVASLQFATFASPSITNGLIAYWPLNSVLGGKTPDVVSSYDMNLNNMTETNVVPGRFGNAFLFNNASQTLLSRVNNPGEDLPIYSHPDFTVSMWVNGPVQPDRRIFSEGSSLQNNTLFNLGTHNGGTDGTLDIYIRSDTGGLNLDHIHSTGIAYDDTWHHIAYVQRDVGGGEMRALAYIDGNQDPVVIAPIRPLTATATAIGGILRSGPSAWFTGMIDEVAVWNRALSPEEIQILQTTTITNPPNRVLPLNIASFRADLPAVIKGGSVVLRWDVSKDVSQVTIDPGIGDVTSKTVGGVGTNLVMINETTTYTLTARRGTDTLTAATTVGVVDGVTPGWTLLDNFDRYSASPLSQVGYWTDSRGNSVEIRNYEGNMVIRPNTGDSVAFLNLRELAVREGQPATLFFRMIPGTNTATGITNLVGLTDKTQRGYGDAYLNIGPVVYAAALTNDFYLIDTNAWYLGARNGYFGNNTSADIEWPPQPLAAPTVYNVWINVTNNSMEMFDSDRFSVYVAKEGDANRTLLFQDYLSDRDFSYVEPVLGGMFPNLDKLVVLGNNANNSAMFDDFYLSRGAYNATVPKPYGFTGPVGPLPALQIGQSGDQITIQWTTGTLQESTSLTGGWTDVPGATPPTYQVTPTATGAKFYRARP